MVEMEMTLLLETEIEVKWESGIPATAMLTPELDVPFRKVHCNWAKEGNM
jgi:hypothetical protein